MQVQQKVGRSPNKANTTSFQLNCTYYNTEVTKNRNTEAKFRFKGVQIAPIKMRCKCETFTRS